MLKNIQIGWVWLERTLNGIIDQINAEKVIAGSGIAIQESPNGVVVSAAKGGTDATAPAAGSGGPTSGFWRTVTVVDPATCAQSQIQVWSK